MSGYERYLELVGLDRDGAIVRIEPERSVFMFVWYNVDRDSFELYEAQDNDSLWGEISASASLVDWLVFTGWVDSDNVY